MLKIVSIFQYITQEGMAVGRISIMKEAEVRNLDRTVAILWYPGGISEGPSMVLPVSGFLQEGRQRVHRSPAGNQFVVWDYPDWLQANLEKSRAEHAKEGITIREAFLTLAHEVWGTSIPNLMPMTKYSSSVLDWRFGEYK